MKLQWRRSKETSEIDEELRFHMASAEADLKKDGVEDAGRAARLQFGNPLSVRDAIVVNWLESLWWDVRLAARSLMKSKAMTAVIVLSLALGIGANTAIFSLIHALLLRSLPVRTPEQLYRVRVGEFNSTFNYPLWDEFRKTQRTFSAVMAWSPMEFDCSEGGATRLVAGAWVSGSTFKTLGLEPALGRLITDSDDRPGGGADGPVAVVSHDFWMSAYGGSPEAIGATIRLNGKPFKVVGVTPEDFRGIAAGERADVMAPVGTVSYVRGTDANLRNAGNWWLRVLGRLEPGVSEARARAELAGLSAGLMARTVSVSDEPVWRERRLGEKLWPVRLDQDASHTQERLRLPLLVLMAVAGCVLLVACANVANLLLARQTARGREMAVRVALGASRARLMRQMLVESLLLAITGGVVGSVCAPVLARALMRGLTTERGVYSVTIDPHPMVWGFTAAVALACGLLFGVWPAWRAARAGASEGLRRRFGDAHAGRLRGVLIASQVAVSVALVSVAWLFTATLRNLAATELGFRPDSVLLASIDMVSSGLAEEERTGFVRRLLDEARLTPGIVAVSASAVTPLSGSTSQTDVSVTLADGSMHKITAWQNQVSAGYFETLGTPLVAGRDISAEDRAGSPAVVVVNEEFAREMFGGANPVGRTVRYRVYRNNVPPADETAEIVGLVRDAKYRSVREAAPPTVYFALMQQTMPRRSIQFEFRSTTTAEALQAPLAALMKAVDERVSYTPRTFPARVREATVVERLVAALSAAFGGLALLLAAMGLYGVLAYTVAQRRAEIGVRMALGATPARIRAWVMRRVGVMVAGGAAVGVGVAIWATRFAKSLLFGVRADDPRVYVGGLLILLCVTALAAYLPARRAARVDPLESLRCE